MAEEKPEVLDAVLKETVDLENIPIKEVLENLRCSKEGLSSEATEERLAIFGHNKLEEKQGKPLDWQDFAVIITLLVINSTISFMKENNEGNAAAALMVHLAPKAKKWSEIIGQARQSVEVLKDQEVIRTVLNILQSIGVSVHVTSDEKKVVQRWPCLWNGTQ